MRFLAVVRNVLNRVTAPAAYGLAGAGVLSVVAMMFVVTFDVIGRYVFNEPTVWAGEVAAFLMIAVVFLGLAQNLHQGGHIRIDILTSLVSARVRLFLDVIAHAIGVVFSVLLLWGCWIRFDNFWIRQTTSDSPIMIPLWIPMLPVMAGAVVFCLVAISGFVTNVHALLNGDPLAPGSGED